MRKFTFVTFCCLFLGSSLYLLATQFLGNSQEKPAPSVALNTAKQIAWIKTAVRAGETVRWEKLEWRPLTDDAFPADAFLRQSDQDGIDPAAVYAQNLSAGSVVRKSYIREPSDPGYVSSLLKRGFRAKVLTIKNLSKYEGFIHRGDAVDILFKSTAALEEQRRDKPLVLPLIRNAKIIGPVAGSGSLMVALNMQDAVKASLAEEIGSLFILLRNREEEHVDEDDFGPLATLADIASRNVALNTAKAQTLPQTVRIMRGSGLTTISVPGRAAKNLE